MYKLKNFYYSFLFGVAKILVKIWALMWGFLGTLLFSKWLLELFMENLILIHELNELGPPKPHALVSESLESFIVFSALRAEKSVNERLLDKQEKEMELNEKVIEEKQELKDLKYNLKQAKEELSNQEKSNEASELNGEDTSLGEEHLKGLNKTIAKWIEEVKDKGKQLHETRVERKSAAQEMDFMQSWRDVAKPGALDTDKATNISVAIDSVRVTTQGDVEARARIIKELGSDYTSLVPRTNLVSPSQRDESISTVSSASTPSDTPKNIADTGISATNADSTGDAFSMIEEKSSLANSLDLLLHEEDLCLTIFLLPIIIIFLFYYVIEKKW
jgi:hypothetical protein